MPKVVRPIIARGLGGLERKWNSQLQRDTPSGSFVPAEYQWGTHALATHAAEGVKSAIFRSAFAAIAVSASIPALVLAPQQVHADVNRSFVNLAVTTGATPRPIAQFRGAPQFADFTQQALLFQPPTGTPQGRVPPFTLGVSQADPSQLAPRLTPSQPAAAITPNPIAGFFVVPPQNEERPTRSIWPAQVAGSRPRVIAPTSGAPQVFDFTQQALVVEPAFSVQVVAYGLRILYAAPQVHDFTQQGVIRGTAQALQAKVPAAIWATQADPSQIAARLFRPTPLVFGRVPPLLRGGQPQFNPYQIPADLCAPLEGSSVAASLRRTYAVQLQERALALQPQARVLSIALQDRTLSITSQDRAEDL